MVSEKRGRAALKKILQAVLYFVVFAMAIPLILGSMAGLAPAQILTLITSTLLLQAAAPPVGLAMGLSEGAILVIMACFALGMVLAILEICDGLAVSSPRVKRWVDNIEKKTQKYPWIQKYGPITCIGIAWIPGVGLYGTPIIAFILKWKRVPSVIFTVTGFVIAAIFVIFFANRIQQVLQFAGNVGVLLLAIFSMLAIGFSLTIPEIRESLKDTKLVSLSLVANFVLVPVIAYLLVTALKLPQDMTVGLVLVGTAAGASVLQKLVEVGKGNMVYARGLMFLLSIITIFYLPLVFPFMVSGVTVNPLTIALALVLLMLIPLCIGLYVRKRREPFAVRWAPRFSKLSTVVLVVVIIAFLALYFMQLAELAQTSELLMTSIVVVIFILLAFGVGYLLAGKDKSYQRVLGMGTGQRNIAAAAVVSAIVLGNNMGLLTVLVTGLISLILFHYLSKHLGKSTP
jgi:predicted Na+-dependent transporter